jgi:hypothetical protein
MVRTVGMDNRESKSSNVVAFRPLASGEFVLSSNHLADNGGFNFDTESRVTAMDPKSDLYLYATEIKTGLSSPARLRAGLRKSAFIVDGSAKQETVLIKTGDRISLYTKTGMAELTILAIDGKSADKSARIGYIFYPDNR